MLNKFFSKFMNNKESNQDEVPVEASVEATIETPVEVSHEEQTVVDPAVSANQVPGVEVPAGAIVPGVNMAQGTPAQQEAPEAPEAPVEATGTSFRGTIFRN